jgi:hypothetical protein
LIGVTEEGNVSGTYGERKVGGEKVVHYQGKEVIYNVYLFMKNEKGTGKQWQLNSYRIRLMLHVLCHRWQIIIVGEHNRSERRPFTAPHKKQVKASPKTEFSNF